MKNGNEQYALIMMQSYLLLRKQIKAFLVTDRKHDPIESEAVN